MFCDPRVYSTFLCISPVSLALFLSLLHFCRSEEKDRVTHQDQWDSKQIQQIWKQEPGGRGAQAHLRHRAGFGHPEPGSGAP